MDYSKYYEYSNGSYPKVGDQIQIIDQDSSWSGFVATVVPRTGNLSAEYVKVAWNGGKDEYVYRTSELKLTGQAEINKASSKKMNLKEKLVLLVTPEPQKSRRKVGITDGDDYPTDEGMKAIVSWWLKNSEDAKKFDEEVVKPLVKELEKENK